MEYIHYLVKMNNWSIEGLVAGFAFGFWLGMMVRGLILKLIHKQFKN